MEKLIPLKPHRPWLELAYLGADPRGRYGESIVIWGQARYGSSVPDVW